MNSPAVSIVMPVYNAARYLSEAVDSVLSQTTSEPWELLIVEDGSEDDSYLLAQTLAAKHPQSIRVLRHRDGRNHGSSAARNLAIDHARAPVLAFLDADDVWLPHALATLLDLLRSYPKAAMVYADAERTWNMTAPPLSEAGKHLGNHLPPLLPPGIAPGLLAPGQPLAWFLHDQTMVPCTCTVLVHTSAAREAGGFIDSFSGLYDDQAFYARLLSRCRAAVSLCCVARYRQHHASCCGRVSSDEHAQAVAQEQFHQWLESELSNSNGTSGSEGQAALAVPAYPTADLLLGGLRRADVCS